MVAKGTKDVFPHLIQRSGFECLYRFLNEPRRLWLRYLWPWLPPISTLPPAAPGPGPAAQTIRSRLKPLPGISVQSNDIVAERRRVLHPHRIYTCSIATHWGTLSIIHTAKRLEWPLVIVFRLFKGSPPSTFTLIDPHLTSVYCTCFLIMIRLCKLAILPKLPIAQR